jgi:16S rRNA G527 N7-methylase RsmG
MTYMGQNIYITLDGTLIKTIMLCDILEKKCQFLSLTKHNLHLKNIFMLS